MAPRPGEGTLLKLASDRSLLRPWAKSDVASLVRQANNLNVAKHLRDRFPHPYTRAHAFAFLTHASSSESVTNLAIDVLLMKTEKNRYLANGHNWQRANLPCYLPGNGGLLYAIGLMAAGWRGAPQKHAPGFPSDGSWTVRWEGLNAGLARKV